MSERLDYRHRIEKSLPGRSWLGVESFKDRTDAEDAALIRARRGEYVRLFDAKKQTSAYPYLHGNELWWSSQPQHDREHDCERRTAGRDLAYDSIARRQFDKWVSGDFAGSLFALLKETTRLGYEMGYSAR